MEFESPRILLIGSIVTEAELKKRYDRHVIDVLRTNLDTIYPTKKGQRKKYRIENPLPATLEEYAVLRTKKYTTDVDSLIDEAYGEIEGLGEEMREAFENMPEGLQQGDVGQRRSDAAGTLENLAGDKPDVPDAAEKITTTFIPAADLGSRPKRASNAADMLTTASGTITDWIAEMEGEPLKEDETKETRDDMIQELQSLADDLETAADELNGVDFPGMYG